MPRRTHVTKDEVTFPGHKFISDMLSLLLGSRASGNFKLKPMLIYNSDNARVSKQQQVVRGALRFI
jgi:hypothetical protein